MHPDKLREHLRSLADSRCKAEHPNYYGSLICVGPNSQRLGPPCAECMREVEHEYELKRNKAHGRELSDEEAKQVRKRLGIS